MSLKQTLAKHNAAGGLYTVYAPSYIYQNLVMTAMHDITPGAEGGEARQSTWQFDFEQPLLTEEAAQNAQNSMMSSITNGTSLGTDELSWSNAVSNIGISAADSVYGSFLTF
jgi:hypothetical protein